LLAAEERYHQENLFRGLDVESSLGKPVLATHHLRLEDNSTMDHPRWNSSDYSVVLRVFFGTQINIRRYLANSYKKKYINC